MGSRSESQRKEQAVMRALQSHGFYQSVAFRKILQGDEEGWNRKTTRASQLCEKHDEHTRFSHFSKYIEPNLGKQMVIVKPKQSVDLTKDWTSFIGSSVAPKDGSSSASKAQRGKENEFSFFFLLEASPPSKTNDGSVKLRDVSRDRVVKLSDLAVPVAWKPGEPFGILVQATPENFSKVGTAFMEGVLELDDGLYVDQIISVDVIGHPFNLVDPLVDKDLGLTLLDDEAGRKAEADEDGRVKSGRAERKKHSSHFTKRVEQRKRSVDEKDSSLMGGMKDPSSKPPNILVYSGSSPTQAEGIFQAASQALEGVLHRDEYVVYHLTRDQLKSHPWAENCALMVTVVGEGGAAEDPFTKEEFDIVSDYVVTGGKLLNLGVAMNFEVGQYAAAGRKSLAAPPTDIRYRPKHSADEVSFKTPFRQDKITVTSEDSAQSLVSLKGEEMVVQCSEDLGKVVHSKLPLVSLEQAPDENARSCLQQILADVLSRLQINCEPEWKLPDLTPCFLIAATTDTSSAFHNAVKPHLKDNKLSASPVSLRFTDNVADAEEKVNADLLTVLSDMTPSAAVFNARVYKSNLKSKVLGNLVMYTEVVPTTMTLFESFMHRVPKTVGVVAIASRQTKGKGRGGNKWLSPLGCAMFTSHIRLATGTKLASKLPFLQHLAALAVVEAIRTRPGYETLDLRVKWPNDIYYGSKQKIGGILVTSSSMGSDIHALIGIGFNVANSKPTLCVNDIIEEYNSKNHKNLATVSVEEVIAWTMNVLETIIGDFQREGHLHFCKRYYTRWLHSNTVVHLEKQEGPEVTVIGLDGSGYLEVKDKNGKFISLQPDGNSFDMLHNLIEMKKR